MRLMLPVCWRQVSAEMLAHKFDRDSLVGASFVQTQPHEVHVVGHQNEDGTNELVTRAGVKEN